MLNGFTFFHHIIQHSTPLYTYMDIIYLNLFLLFNVSRLSPVCWDAIFPFGIIIFGLENGRFSQSVLNLIFDSILCFCGVSFLSTAYICMLLFARRRDAEK